jgi:hypothetical protein
MSDISIDIVKRDINLEVTILGGGTGATDKNYTQPFINQTDVTVNHNLNKKPATTIIDSAGDEVFGNVTHISDNSLQVSFSSSFTGTVFCN